MAQVSRVFTGLPPHAAGQRIGLYGGSFNPAHAGHRQVSLFAIRRLGLDWIWWVVTPGNPLKDVTALPRLADRLEAAARIASHPRIVVTGAEAKVGTTYTMDFIRILKRRSPLVRFVWIMGSDNLVQFHQWERWRAIADCMPIAVVNRPGHLMAPLAARAAHALAARRIDERDAPILAGLDPPAWMYLTGPRTPASSTALRDAPMLSS